MENRNEEDINLTQTDKDNEGLGDKSKKPKKPIRKKKRMTGKKKAGIIAAAVAAALIVGVGVFLIVAELNKPAAGTVAAPVVNIEEILEPLPAEIDNNGPVGRGVLEHIVGAGRAVENAYGLRPPTVELTEENKADFVKIEECIIADNGAVNVKTSSDGIPKSDDKFYYLFALNAYDSSLPEGAEAVAKSYKNNEGVFQCQLNKGSSSSRLYKKFAVGVKIDGNYELISRGQFITNPEACAQYANVYMKPSSKKGILIDYSKYKTGQLEDLGVKQVAINFRTQDFMGPSTNALFPTINYSYNGKNYSFNGAALSGFDETIRYLTEQNISVTAILLNSYSSKYISMIHPDARSKNVCPYYMFNAATEDGVDYLAAVGSFFAERYSGSKHGRISNWVIANEINARKEWNYMAYTDVDTYTRAYADAFRVFYNAIKSTSGSARVFISLDQQWNRDMKNNPDYDGKDVLDSFNSYICAHGNIDWGMAYHPYNVPLTSCNTWSSSKYVKHSSDTPMISMQNIEVLINYLNQRGFLAPDGSHRNIMITELGYTSSGSGGESSQAAAIAYAFYKINHYEDIDGLLLNRQTDDATEIAQGLATGVTTLSGAKKASYDVFKYMDTSEAESHMAFAKSIIGISNWSDIMR
ncbi:MAG: hypothetical protein K5888_07735 [Lachnospiraceae bacterium]|nr:hypothetical protein [Lachnospiraceae bacterium]